MLQHLEAFPVSIAVSSLPFKTCTLCAWFDRRHWQNGSCDWTEVNLIVFFSFSFINAYSVLCSLCLHSSCVSCPTGKAQLRTGSSSCVDCAPGSFASSTASIQVSQRASEENDRNGGLQCRNACCVLSALMLTLLVTEFHDFKTARSSHLRRVQNRISRFLHALTRC